MAAVTHSACVMHIGTSATCSPIGEFSRQLPQRATVSKAVQLGSMTPLLGHTVQSVLVSLKMKRHQYQLHICSDLMHTVMVAHVTCLGGTRSLHPVFRNLDWRTAYSQKAWLSSPVCQRTRCVPASGCRFAIAGTCGNRMRRYRRSRAFPSAHSDMVPRSVERQLL